MWTRTHRKWVVLTLLATLLAASPASGPAFASQTPPKATSISPGVTPAGQPAMTSPGTLSVLAGRRAYNLGPGPATRASLDNPSGVAVDTHGDLFIADEYDNVVEKVTPAGRLSVVAGVARKSGPPTPGLATSSDLDSPSGVAVDAHGDLFIADQGNHVVEEVTPAGRLSVLAGDGQQGPPKPGPANSSKLYGPSGVAVDTHGDLFIADPVNQVVEEVTPAGRLSVVAGEGQLGSPTPGPANSSKLGSPYGVAVDNGDLFIADEYDNVVEKVSPAGTLSVVAGVVGNGNGGPPTPGPARTSELDSPSGVAVDDHGDLFIADTDNQVVEEVTSAGRLAVAAGNVAQGPPTPGPATSSKLDTPSGVAVDAQGDLFIADWDNDVVEEVTPAGKLSVVAGDGRFDAPPTPGPADSSTLVPLGVAVDAHGDLFIADYWNNVVEEVSPAGRLSIVAGDGNVGRPTLGPANSSRLDAPEGVAVDAHGDLFIADYWNNVVEEVSPAGRLSVVAGDGQLGSPTPGPATSSKLDNPSGVAVGTHGDLFIADRGNNVVEKVTASGTLSVVAGVVGNGNGGPPTPGPARSSELDNPSGVAVDAHGDLFIADTDNQVVEEVTPAGRLSVVAGGTREGAPTPGPATRSGLSFPVGVAVDAHGDLFIADQGNNDVEKVTF